MTDDWRVIDKDQWGATAIGFRRITAWVDKGGEDITFDVEPGQDRHLCFDVPLVLLRALTRAHDLRTKAKGTECPSCQGSGEGVWAHRDGAGNEVPCKCLLCQGNGLALTSAEQAKWERDGKL